MIRVCPVCNNVMDIFVPPERQPGPGDVTMCAECDTVLEFGDIPGTMVRCEDPGKVMESRKVLEAGPPEGGYKLGCGVCMNSFDSPHDMMEHMVETGHSIDGETWEALKTDPEARAAIVEMLSRTMIDPTGFGEPVNPEELPPEVAEAYDRVATQELKKKGWFH